MKLESFGKAVSADGSTVLAAVYRIPRLDVTMNPEYSLDNESGLHVGCRFIPGSKPLPELPRLGMTMTLPGDYDRMEWYGRDRERAIPTGANRN